MDAVVEWTYCDLFTGYGNLLAKWSFVEASREGNDVTKKEKDEQVPV
jgi:hypothetical protein